MKTFKLIPVLLCIFMLNVASMCSKDDDNSSSSNTHLNNVMNTVSSGTWKITLYNDSGTIKTSNYSGYNFTFGSGNALSASNGTNFNTGIWSVADSNSNDDSIDDLDLVINFNSPANFAELTDDWDIVTYSASKIELRDVSGGNGGTDLLTFQKN
ncbi:hypothetical protein [Flavobacterium sp.]|uniref:hypothetical protein n=1 Tax=Flavobacterium sp. TaxID=239 RepID=UPI00262FF8C3|nr:hypothetical protein [Flavobacterium sp.]